MKKLIIGSIFILSLTGCNRQIIDMEYEYHEAVCNYDGDKFVLKIDKWTDYEGEQIQVISKGNTYLLSTNKCYLTKDGNK